MGAELKVNVGGNASGFQQVLNQVRTQAGAFNDSFQREVIGGWSGLPAKLIGGFAAAFSVESIKNYLSGIFETSRSIRDTAEQFDISTDAVQKWEKAMEKAGIQTGTFYRSLEAFRQKVGSAGRGHQGCFTIQKRRAWKGHL